MADVNIRRLIETAATLYPGGGGSSRREHSLGHRIDKDLRYAHSLGAVYLPRGGASLDNLRAAFSIPVLDLDAALNGSAWRALLSSSAVIELPVPGEEQLLTEGVVVTARRLSDLRRFAVVSVLSPGPEALRSDGTPINARIGAAARLTILTNPSTRRNADDAWVAPEWKQSTAMLTSWVARHLEQAGTATIRRLGKARLGLLIHPERAEFLTDPARRSAAVAAAAAFGFSLRFLDPSVSDYGNVRSSLRREPPSALVALGRADSWSVVLTDAYRQAAPRSGLLWVDADDPEEATVVIRDAIAHVAGVGPGLHLIGDPAATWVAGDVDVHSGVIPIPPVARAADCRHDDGNRYYLRDAESDLWWTCDTAGHAQCVFKTYRKVGSQLVHDADRDASGAEIHKWKSDVGKRIELASLHGCEDPTRHLR